MTILYEPSRGTSPSAQSLSFFAFGPAVTETVGTTATVLDTATSLNAQAGYIGKTPKLDRARGFTITFAVEVVQEAHSSEHRAGFSVIALSNDKRGIELGFWPDRVWAQQGGAPPGLFTQAEGVAIDTAAPATYTLRIQTNSYVLSQSGIPVLTGTLRSYAEFGGFPDPYETPNFLFFGDDTGSAGAIVKLGAVSINSGPCLTYAPTVRARPTSAKPRR